MPLEPRTVPLDSTDPVQIVAPGQRISGLNTTFCPRGVQFGVKFGNSQLIDGLSGRPTFVIGADAPESDVREGVWIVPAAVAQGLVIKFAVSFYTPPR